MKIEIILELISGVFLALGCVLYIIYNRKDEENKKTLLIILSIIFTAAGIGLFIGLKLGWKNGICSILFVLFDIVCSIGVLKLSVVCIILFISEFWFPHKFPLNGILHDLVGPEERTRNHHPLFLAMLRKHDKLLYKKRRNDG